VRDAVVCRIAFQLSEVIMKRPAKAVAKSGAKKPAAKSKAKSSGKSGKGASVSASVKSAVRSAENEVKKIARKIVKVGAGKPAGKVRTPASQKTAGTAQARKDNDAVAILEADHAKVKTLFNAFKRLKKAGGSGADKEKIVTQICDELVIHTTVEEEIFYPAVRKAIHDDDLMDEADVEHAGAKDLIKQLRDMKPGDSHYDAKVTVLGEEIDHHVQEEQDDMFKKARRAKIDIVTLGAIILERKRELQGQVAQGDHPAPLPDEQPSLAQRLFGLS
jgi:hemerythrin superfamily protein